MAETPTLTITLTREQQLQVLVTTGLMVTTLELPVEAWADEGEALAWVPLPVYGVQVVAGSNPVAPIRATQVALQIRGRSSCFDLFPPRRPAEGFGRSRTITGMGAHFT
jgi:hypothetical protein